MALTAKDRELVATMIARAVVAATNRGVERAEAGRAGGRLADHEIVEIVAQAPETVWLTIVNQVQIVTQPSQTTVEIRGESYEGNESFSFTYPAGQESPQVSELKRIQDNPHLLGWMVAGVKPEDDGTHSLEWIRTKVMAADPLLYGPAGPKYEGGDISSEDL